MPASYVSRVDRVLFYRYWLAINGFTKYRKRRRFPFSIILELAPSSSDLQILISSGYTCAVFYIGPIICRL